MTKTTKYLLLGLGITVIGAGTIFGTVYYYSLKPKTTTNSSSANVVATKDKDELELEKADKELDNDLDFDLSELDTIYSELNQINLTGI
ncbi:MAG: hypothetical protein M1355_03915 [Patescibacteria group bacterium]|nr:hypothetical protein [Patescibacteria group bacterium]